MENLQRFTAIGDVGGVATIWASCVICLGHLAALSHLVSQTDPASSALMNELYDLTLGKLGHLFLEAHIEEYSNFDILTGVRIFSSHEAGSLPGGSTGLDILGQGIEHNRQAHRIAPRHRERIVGALEKGYREDVYGFSSKISRVPTQLVRFFCHFGRRSV